MTKPFVEHFGATYLQLHIKSNILHTISLTDELHKAMQVIDMIMEFDKRLDNIFLNELYDGDAMYAATVFDTFLQEVGNLLNSCFTAIESGDIPQFQKSVHKLKPTLSYVGLTDIGKQLEKLEKACGTGNSVQDLKTTYLQIAEDINNLLPLIKSEKDKLDALTLNTN